LVSGCFVYNENWYCRQYSENLHKNVVGKPEGKRPVQGIILKRSLKKQGRDLIHLAEDRIQWWTFVNLIVEFLPMLGIEL
jgi:hypothetical protein